MSLLNNLMGALCVTGVVVLATVACGQDLLPPMDGYADDFALRRAGIDVDANIKLSVSQEGLHKVTRGELVAAGVPADRLVGDQMRLFCRTWETAIYVSTEGLFGADDFFLFWAQPYESTYTKTNVYWFGFGADGQRMDQRSGLLIPGDPAIVSYRHRTVYSPELMFFNNFMPNDSSFDHWFAGFMSGGTNVNNTFSIWSGNRLDSGTAYADLSLHGGDDYAGTLDHITSVKINGTTVGSLTYDGRSAFTGRVSFASSTLGTTSTSVTLNQTQTGNAEDRAYLESFTLDFERPLASVDDATLYFGGATGGCNYVVTGFAASAGGFHVVDASDPVSPVILTDCAVSNVAGSYTVSFGDSAPTARLYGVVASAGAASVDRIEHVPFRNLALTSRQAEYILICPYAFRTSAYRLLKRRYLGGLSVVVAPIEDIYNEFSYGIADAGAVKQFVGFAYHHWQAPVPKYVLLAGEGTYDPKGNLGMSADNVLPVRLGPSSWRWTATDNWFVQVSGMDELIDLSVGRIPVTTDAALGVVVDKIAAYETAIKGTGTWKKKATLVADNDTVDQGFKAATEAEVASHLSPAGFSIVKSYLDDNPDVSLARTMIASGFANGRFLITFFGHGAVDFWTGEQVWTSSDVQALSNTVYPIVAMFTCQTGYFQDPAQECISETMLERSAAGAVACLGPSIAADRDYSAYVADGFVGKLVDAGPVRLGDALVAGMTALFVHGNQFREELRAYHIFGDPATLVRPE